MVKSGLRGRGGAGFPTGLKWGTVAKSPGAQEIRHLQRRRGRPRRVHGPQRVGKRSAQRAGRHGHRRLRRRREPGLHLRAAPNIRWPSAGCRSPSSRPSNMGLLGSGIFESPFNFNIDLRIGAGAFVCGEETALMASVEGKRGTPRPRPPFPAESGLWGCPTLINNVETFANVPPIYPQGRGVVRRHRHREKQGHQGLCARRQNQQHRPDRSADGHAPAANRRGNGRRRSRRRARSRPCRPAALPAAAFPAAAPRHAGGLRIAQQARLHHGFGRHDRHGRHAPTWWTSRASSWSSAWTNPAANAFPAAPARCRCTICSTKSSNRKATARDLAKLEELCDMVTQHQPLRPRPDRAQSDAEHAALFPQ